MLNFEKTNQVKGTDIGFKIKFSVTPETDPNLTSDNPLITPEVQRIITPDLLDSIIQIHFFTPQEIDKEYPSPLLTLSSTGSPSVKLHIIGNTSTVQEVIGVIKGSQSSNWKIGKIYYIIEILPLGADSYSRVSNSKNYFILT